MVNKQQEYVSGVLKNIGFAMLTPFGSVIFQWVVFEKGAYFEHFAHSVLIFLNWLGIYCRWIYMAKGEG